MNMAMSLKPAPKLGVISVYRMKIHWAVAELSYFFTLFIILYYISIILLLLLLLLLLFMIEMIP